jgi:hypothetical protein
VTWLRFRFRLDSGVVLFESESSEDWSGQGTACEGAQPDRVCARPCGVGDGHTEMLFSKLVGNFE